MNTATPHPNIVGDDMLVYHVELDFDAAAIVHVTASMPQGFHLAATINFRCKAVVHQERAQRNVMTVEIQGHNSERKRTVTSADQLSTNCALKRSGLKTGQIGSSTLFPLIAV